MLKYKGYSASVELDEEAAVAHGEVLDLGDVITFEGTTVQELEQAFRDSVDDYLDLCRSRGEEPDRPFSGRLMLRLPPDVHRKAYVRAKAAGKSLNQWVADQLAKAS